MRPSSLWREQVRVQSEAEAREETDDARRLEWIKYVTATWLTHCAWPHVARTCVCHTQLCRTYHCGGALLFSLIRSG